MKYIKKLKCNTHRSKIVKLIVIYGLAVKMGDDNEGQIKTEM